MRLFFLLLLCSLSVSSYKRVAELKEPIGQRSISKIVIKSVDFGTATWGRISCDAFNKHFPDANTILVISRGTLDAINRRMALLKMYEGKGDVDTRAKITIYYGDSTISTVCIGGAVMRFDGKKVKYDKELTSLLGILVE
ncbi:hypothetical protein [Hymenobacter perfusus]|uniref:Uncharacterized protein n=1 Tax=Hymenobacter perfusus TaxID=1236770 RepID=A0A3R9UXK0_9BACT|nr:hypothetical protein [Hymenobacter perfusus]RSK42293.1 hypothetical protein EI293_15340 [Hymenobacter perfusus]